MCGIAGILGGDWGHEQRVALCSRMTATLEHRGPDDRGIFVSDTLPVAMGHRRLSIIDTSEAGHQPMTSRSGRWTIVFNGEIYNARDLRRELPPDHEPRGHSDTEVLCELIACLGVERTLSRLVGMFAFGAWDHQERSLTLVRDRIGIKPLYVGVHDRCLGFASELRALGAVPGLVGEVSRPALASLLRFGYIPGPLSIREHVRKVAPGTMMVASIHEGQLRTRTSRWWSAEEHASMDPITSDPVEAVELVGSAIRESVRDRMVADRPLGAFLSGGIDSSLVVAAMSAVAAGPVKTYSIGFHETQFDEAGHARDVAAHLGTDHTEHYVETTDAIEIVPGLGSMFDEPFADSSQIPTALVSRLARQDVVVVLSGDGGDELFGGYDRYAWTTRLWSRISRIPWPARKAMAMGIAAIPPRLAASMAAFANRCLPARMRIRNPADKARLMSLLIVARDPMELYRSMIGHWKQPGTILAGGLEPGDQPLFPAVSPQLELRHQMMMVDLHGYLPDDILVKVDRTTMNVGLEARVPLLDHRLVELAWRLPVDLKYRDGHGKWLLRQVLGKDVPSRHWDRPKQGFGVPIGEWLRGPLRDWSESLLGRDRLVREGFFRPDPVRSTWKQHLTGPVDHGAYLWDILMFQSWLDSNRPSP